MIQRAEVRRADLRWALPERLAERLTGARVLGLRRRAKYILIRLDTAESMLLHLGMSGRVLIRPRGANAPILHEHVVIVTDDDWEIGLVDPRRFGSIDLMPTADEEAHRLLAGLGPEPLDRGVHGEACWPASLEGKRTPIKAALLDQRVVAGLGNIYVCEALYRADHRADPAGRRTRRRGRLVPAIKATLREAIEAGGSSLRDYVQPGGELGYFQHAWRVYGHEGEPCPRCPGPPSCPGIARMVQSGRSTFYCPRLQTLNEVGQCPR